MRRNKRFLESRSGKFWNADFYFPLSIHVYIRVRIQVYIICVCMSSHSFIAATIETLVCDMLLLRCTMRMSCSDDQFELFKRLVIFCSIINECVAEKPLNWLFRWYLCSHIIYVRRRSLRPSLTCLKRTWMFNKCRITIRKLSWLTGSLPKNLNNHSMKKRNNSN